MTIDQIADLIWQLPWYKVVIIAMYDDFILMCKIWPAWCLIIGSLIGCIVLYSRQRTQVEDLKIGDTNLSQFHDVEFQIIDDHTTDPMEVNEPTVQATTPNMETILKTKGKI